MKNIKHSITIESFLNFFIGCITLLREISSQNQKKNSKLYKNFMTIKKVWNLFIGCTWRLPLPIMVFFQGYCRFNSFVCYFLAVFRKKVNIVNICLGYILYWSILSSFILNNWYCKCLLQLSGDIEWNSVLQRNSCKHLSICYWNLSSINSHNFVKASLLTVYNSIHKFNIICLS